MRHGCLALLGLLFSCAVSAAGPAPASTSAPSPPGNVSMHASNMDICRLSLSTMKEYWRYHAFAVPDDVSAIMLEATEGDTANMRAGLARLPRDHVAFWRQIALSQAVLGNHPQTVRALIADGADPKGRAWYPAYKPAFYRHGMKALEKDPHLGGLASSLHNSGIDLNQGWWQPEPIFWATRCDQTQVMNILFQSGVSANAVLSHANFESQYVLTDGVLNGNPDATRLLLDHGADPCLVDRRIRKRAQLHHLPKPITIADIAQRTGFPADLVARLRCHAP